MVLLDTEHASGLRCPHSIPGARLAPHPDPNCLQGRLRALQKKLKDIATLVFIDAPYVLPLWYKPSTDPLQDPPQQHPPAAAPAAAAASFPAGIPKPKRAWLLSQVLLQAQPGLQELFSRAQEGTQNSAASNPDQSPGSHLAQQQEQQQPEQQQRQQQQEQQLVAWLPAPAHIATHEQYTTQALGWEESWHTIQAALAGAPLLQQPGEPCDSRQLPAVDGILGFSQGAAVAAVVAALRQQQQQQQAGHARRPSQLKFVLIASGFPSPAPEHQALLQEQAPIALPSLHMFAAAAEGGGGDRQIEQQMSERLMGMFAEDSRRVVVHGGGHMVPTDTASVADIRAFLQQFL